MTSRLLTAVGVAGAPAAGRLTTTFRLDGGVLVDAGAAAHGLSPEEQRSVAHVLLTHAHLDHTLGVPFLLGPAAGMRLYGLQETLDAVRESLLDGRIWPDLHERAKWQAVEPGEPFDAGPWRVEAALARHTVPCAAYALEAGGATAVIAGDTRWDEELADWAAARAPALCVVECSFPASHAAMAARYGHQVPADLARWRKALGPGPRLLVYHGKPGHERALRDECRELGDPGLILLDDGDAQPF